jgi:hypothetical protein
MVQSYKRCGIEVFTRFVGESFNSYASVRNFGAVTSELPSGFIVNADRWRYSTEEEALAAGLRVTKSIIDEAR